MRRQHKCQDCGEEFNTLQTVVQKYERAPKEEPARDGPTC